MMMMMSSWICVLCVWHGCFRRAFWRRGVRKNATKSPIYCTWNSLPNQGVPERYAVPWKTSQMSRVLPQQFRLDDRRGWILCPFKTAPGSTGSSFLNVHNRALFFLFHSIFGQPTASFFWRIHTWRIRRVRRDSGAASAAAQSELERRHSAVRQ